MYHNQTEKASGEREKYGASGVSLLAFRFAVRMTGLDLRLLSPWESKLWSGSVKPSPAALVRVAFKWVRVPSDRNKKERPKPLLLICISTHSIIQGCKDNDSFALGKLGKKYNQNMPLENQNNYAYNYCSPNTVITNEGGKDNGIT